jgi:mannitol-specific phosphotransferase system IIBC component
MRKLLHLFFGLLVPLSMLFILAATLYFKLDYDFTKAIRLGVLSGFFIGLFVSFFTAIFLLIMRRGTQPQEDILKRPKKRKVKQTKNVTIEETKKDKNIQTEKVTSSTKTRPTVKGKHPTTHHKIMLLMDNKLAFEVALQAITEKKIGVLTANDEGEGYLTINAKDETLELSILSLTRHTTQVSIDSHPDSENAKKLITYLKEKELSFLQY